MSSLPSADQQGASSPEGARHPADAPRGSRPSVPPRTPWGDPDLQGTYTNKYEQNTPLERPAEFAGRRIEDFSAAERADIFRKRQQQATDRAPAVGPPQFRDNLDVARGQRLWFIVDPPDGRIPPMTPAAAKRIGPPDPFLDGGGLQGIVNSRQRTSSSFDQERGQGRFNGPQDLGLWDRCITRGLPGAMMPYILGNYYEIVQAPGFVSIRYELPHDTRVIPLDPVYRNGSTPFLGVYRNGSAPFLGRPHVSSRIEMDLGDARGHWEGDSLVIVTTNFKDRSVYRNANAAALRLIERFTRTAPGQVEWAVTVDDPTTWTRPWTFSIPLASA